MNMKDRIDHLDEMVNRHGRVWSFFRARVLTTGGLVHMEETASRDRSEIVVDRHYIFHFGDGDIEPHVDITIKLDPSGLVVFGAARTSTLDTWNRKLGNKISSSRLAFAEKTIEMAAPRREQFNVLVVKKNTQKEWADLEWGEPWDSWSGPLGMIRYNHQTRLNPVNMGTVDLGDTEITRITELKAIAKMIAYGWTYYAEVPGSGRVWDVEGAMIRLLDGEEEASSHGVLYI